MFRLLNSYFTDNISFNTMVKRPMKQNKPNHIYRDELDKRRSSSSSSSSTTSKLVRRRVAKGEAKPLLQRDEDHGKKCEKMERGGEGGRIKVKILMTKEEASRLLLKCKEGGVLEFKDVARELVQIPTSRVTVSVSSSSSPCSGLTSTCDDRVLASIPEEL